MTPHMISHLPNHDRVAVRRFTANHRPPCRMMVHDHATIALFLEGTSTFWMQGHYELGTGAVLLVPAGTPPHNVEVRGVRSLGLSLCLSCLPDAPGQELSELFDAVRKGACARRQLQPGEPEELEALILRLEQELQTPAPGRKLAVDALMTLLTVMLLRASEAPRSEQRTGASLLVAKALRFVDLHALEGISLSDVARHVARSPAHLAALVKDETGETVGGWIMRARMTQCRQLLIHTDETIERIADRCGFASPSHFHRAFKKMHQMTPGQWRHAYRT